MVTTFKVVPITARKIKTIPKEYRAYITTKNRTGGYTLFRAKMVKEIDINSIISSYSEHGYKIVNPRNPYRVDGRVLMVNKDHTEGNLISID